MEIKEVKAYKFDELAESVQQELIEKVQYDELYLNYNWYSCVYEGFKSRMLENHNITVENISFSGFYHQGSYASFEGYYSFDSDTENYNKKLREVIEKSGFIISIKQNNGPGMSVHPEGFHLAESRKQEDTLYQKYEEIKKIIEDEAGKLSKELRDEYERLLNKEVVKEYIINKDIDYTVNGEVLAS